jgi:putative acetyltransferase
MTITIRAARASDYQDVYDIMACPGVVRNTLQLPFVSLDVRKARLDNPQPNIHVLVAEVDGRVVGNIALNMWSESVGPLCQFWDVSP